MKSAVQNGDLFEVLGPVKGEAISGLIVNITEVQGRVLQLALGRGVPRDFSLNWIEILLYIFPEVPLNGGWQYLDSISLPAHDKLTELSLRVSAGNVYKNNELLRTETSKDAQIPGMRISREGIVAIYAEELRQVIDSPVRSNSLGLSKGTRRLVAGTAYLKELIK